MVWVSKPKLADFTESVLDLVKTTGTNVESLRIGVLQLNEALVALHEMVEVQEKRINLLEKTEGWQDKESDCVTDRLDAIEAQLKE